MVYLRKETPRQSGIAETRSVQINDDTKNKELRVKFKYTNNWVSTSKYTFISFVPKTLFEFFRVIANMYFLFISIIQLASDWSPTNQYTTAGPLVIVLIVSMIKQAIEDKKRHDADGIQNHRICSVLQSNGELHDKQWQQVEVGDILFLKDKDELPADILILATSEEEGRCFVETCNLDGETNLKRRTACEPIAQLIGFRALNDPLLDETRHKEGCINFKGTIEYEQPNNRLYNFSGRVASDMLTDVVPIGPTNIILRGCGIRSCSYVFGIVLFAGKESKLMQNARATPSKQSNVYKTVNRCIILIFFTQTLLCVISALSFNSWVNKILSVHAWYLPFIKTDSTAFFTFLILYNNLVPISLYVSLDMVKVAQAKNISNDPEMCHEGFHAIARTSDLNEDLGQIEYIFSDKTGTLTQNIMEFRKCSIGGTIYGYGSTEIAEAVASLAKRRGSAQPGSKDGPAKDIKDAQIFPDKSIHFDDPRLIHELVTGGPNSARIEEFLTFLSVCHTVIPEKNLTTGAVNYRASSPDEEALVKAARCLGYKLVTPAPLVEVEVTHKNKPSTMKSFTILNVNEFNSTRKRMSTVVQFSDGKIVLYCKGADNVILPRSKRVSGDLEADLKSFASEGLRTLVLAKRELQHHEYEEWNRVYQAAATSLSDRDMMLDAAAEVLEVDMEIVGATAIEDKLQVGVPHTIYSLAQAGIKIWVLTGDKEETAVNIGHACRLLNDGMQLLFINRETMEELTEQLDYLYNMEAIQTNYRKKTIADNIAIVCDGKSLVHFFPSKSQSPEEKAKSKELRRKLLVVASVCKALIACRVSPAQKADIVNMVRYHSHNKPITLAIGDGANDVNMIQSAHVGIGICGQEGVQAVNASDYAIAQFRFLQRLLLVHGRSNYKRIAKVILYSFYKNMSLVIVLFLFNFYNGQSGTSLFESFVMAGWNFFLALPIIAIGIFDEDVSPEQAMAFPPLYLTGQRNEDLNIRYFSWWIFNAFYHAFISFWLPLYIVKGYTTEAFHLQGTTVYSGLLMTMNLKVIYETLAWTVFSYGFIVFSFLLFFFFLAVYPSVPNLGAEMIGVPQVMLSSGLYWLVFFLIPVACMLIDISIKYCYKNYRPTEADILREHGLLQKQQLKIVDMSVNGGPVVSQPRSVQELQMDEKAGVRNLDMAGYTGFAFSAPDDKIVNEVDKNAAVREIATMRVDHYNVNGELDLEANEHGRSFSSMHKVNQFNSHGGMSSILGNSPVSPLTEEDPSTPVDPSTYMYRKIVCKELSTDFRRATELVSVPKSTLKVLPGTVLVKNTVVGINASDINYTNGKYLEGVNPPFDCGFEGVGHVEEVGAGVKRLKKGDAVVYTLYGAFAEYIVVPVKFVQKVPIASAAILPLNVCGLTASMALDVVGEMKSGETVLVTAAAGATGQFAIQLAKLAGNTVIGTCSSPEKQAYLTSIGCDRAIDYTKEDLGQVLSREFPRGVNLVFESVGGKMLETCVEHLAKHGRLIVIGSISGYEDSSSWTNTSSKPVTSTLLAKSASIRGFFLNSFVKDHGVAHTRKLMTLVRKGLLSPGVDSTSFHGLESVPDAIDYLYARKNIGKVVVHLNSASL